MEFGLFQGGFVHRDMRAANPNAEHDRLVSEVALCEVGDQHNWYGFDFTVPANGAYTLSARTRAGVEIETEIDLIAERWAVIDYWGEVEGSR